MYIIVWMCHMILCCVTSINYFPRVPGGNSKQSHEIVRFGNHFFFQNAVIENLECVMTIYREYSNI